MNEWMNAWILGWLDVVLQVLSIEYWPDEWMNEWILEWLECYNTIIEYWILAWWMNECMNTGMNIML